MKQNDDKWSEKELGDYTVGYNGCGAIAIYNVLISLGNPWTFDTVLQYFNKDTSRLFFDGKFGMLPEEIATFFESLGYVTRMTTGSRGIEQCSEFIASLRRCCMKVINRLLLCIAIALVCTAVAAAGTLIVGMIYFEPPDEVFGPEDGVWHCEELGVQISFEEDIHSIVIVDDKPIVCASIRDSGSTNVMVFSQVRSDQCEYGDLMFCGRFIELENNKYVLRDMETREIHVFVPGELAKDENLHQRSSSSSTCP